MYKSLTSSKRSPLFWLLIGGRKLVFFWHDSEPRTAKTDRPQGLFSPFFTFLRAIFFRPFRLSLAPTICPWVSEHVSETACRRNDRSPYHHVFVILAISCEDNRRHFSGDAHTLSDSLPWRNQKLSRYSQYEHNVPSIPAARDSPL